MTKASRHELAGMKAVVTGAASGIGRAMALELTGGGADVLIHARRSVDALEELARQIRHAGRDAEVVLCDLADADGHERFVAQCWDWADGVDIWINNAGVDVLTEEPAGWAFECKLEALWRVDVVATMALARDVGRRMKARGRGVILNMGWDQAEHGMAGDSGELFAATKGAVMAFSKSLARSLAPEVRVNCLAPGWIKTAWGESATAAWQTRAARESLLGRWGTPEDVARVARFLVSPAAAFVTGQTIPINGGLRQS